MDEKTIEGLKSTFRTVVDEVMEQKLAGAVGPLVAAETKAIVEKMRLDQATRGSDITGLTNEEKLTFAEATKALVGMRTKANEALISETDARGGYLVPVEVANAIQRIAASVGIVFSQAQNWPMNSDELDIPSYTGSFLEGEYLGLDAAGSVTAMGFGHAKLITKKWQVAFVVANDLLQDATPDLGAWLLAIAGESLANMADKQGIAGTGAPFVGILNHPDVAAYNMASTHETFAEFTLDDASDCVASLEESVLDGAAFLFHRTVWAKIRMQKDGDNRYALASAGILVNANFRQGGPRPAGQLLDYPVYTCRHLPANSATAVSTKYGIFGNLKGLAIGMRGDLRLEQFRSGAFGGKEVALSDQIGLVYKNRHAIVVSLPGAFVNITTAAS